jgi:hypothetical protein
MIEALKETFGEALPFVSIILLVFIWVAGCLLMENKISNLFKNCNKT